MTDRRVLPHDTEAEASILGGVLLRNDVLALLPDLEPRDFYDPRHRAVFEAMRDLEARATPIDTTTVEFELARRDKLDACGGIGFLGELALKVPTADNVVAYAAIVTKLSQARTMMLAMGDLAEAGYTDGLEDADEYVATAERKVLEISRKGRQKAARTIGAMTRDRMKQLEEIAARRARGEQAITGVPTGIAALDELMGGYRREIITVVAGRPKAGKSSMGMAAADATTAAGLGTMVFSLEDGESPYSDSAIARRSGVPTTRLRAAELERADMGQIAAAMADYRKRDKLWRFESILLDAPAICRELRRAKAEMAREGIDLALGIIDYLQLVKRPTDRGMNANEAIAFQLACFAAIAKELNIALMILSQLNRDLEKRDDKRPTMPDLRGSGAIEEVAKAIVFVYRGSTYYSEPKKEIDYDCDCPAGATWCNHRPSAQDFESTMQIIIAADNQGQTGRVFAKWDGPTKTVS